MMLAIGHGILERRHEFVKRYSDVCSNLPPYNAFRQC
jgi:hypothetical protein